MARRHDIDGGSAFPVVLGGNREISDWGLSVRDWYVGQAMTAMARLIELDDEADDFKGLAKQVVAFADAVFAESRIGVNPVEDDEE